MNDGTTTDLYLVRIWRTEPVEGAPNLHGKLQHVVSGAACFFDGLSSLPGALEGLIEQESGLTTRDANIEPNDKPEPSGERDKG